MRIIAEGAEAQVFKAVLLGDTVIVKTRKAKGYRIKAIDDDIRASRTRIEARVMERAHSSGIMVPRLIAVDSFSIYMGLVDGKLMKDARIRKDSYGRLGRILGIMHNADIVHGDFTPANIMVAKDGLYVIDFGLSGISKSHEEKALDVLLMKRSLGESQYRWFIDGYTHSGRESKAIMGRLAEIELRGRYQVRTLG
ncbi:MAG: Kae1-associated serine/threonine protein kinase [Candidatus Micrarchaeota archaeon]|nr:Kae1-associated serine/threonine protein kinase [Candidatus Micrarchaeota archaeon]